MGILKTAVLAATLATTPSCDKGGPLTPDQIDREIAGECVRHANRVLGMDMELRAVTDDTIKDRNAHALVLNCLKDKEPFLDFRCEKNPKVQSLSIQATTGDIICSQDQSGTLRQTLQVNPHGDVYKDTTIRCDAKAKDASRKAAEDQVEALENQVEALREGKTGTIQISEEDEEMERVKLEEIERTRLTTQIEVMNTCLNAVPYIHVGNCTAEDPYEDIQWKWTCDKI